MAREWRPASGGGVWASQTGMEAIAGVVALLAGKHLRVIHGTRDRWTSATWSRNFVERCQGFAESATWTSMPGVGHFMLRRVGKWNQFVEDSVSDILGLALQKGAPTEGTP